MLIPNNSNLIGMISNTINTQDMINAGMSSNFGYLTVLIMINETIMLNINVRYGLYNPLKYSVANMNAIPGIGNPMKSFVSILSAIILYLVSLKTPQITINKLTSINIC